MGNNGSAINITQPQMPVFNGDSYEFWSIKMRTLFKSQGLWEFVENGYEESSEGERHEENVS